MIGYKPIAEIEALLEQAKAKAKTEKNEAIVMALEAVVLMLAREGNNY